MRRAWGLESSISLPVRASNHNNPCASTPFTPCDANEPHENIKRNRFINGSRPYIHWPRRLLCDRITGSHKLGSRCILKPLIWLPFYVWHALFIASFARLRLGRAFMMFGNKTAPKASTHTHAAANASPAVRLLTLSFVSFASLPAESVANQSFFRFSARRSVIRLPRKLFSRLVPVAACV